MKEKTENRETGRRGAADADARESAYSRWCFVGDGELGTESALGAPTGRAFIVWSTSDARVFASPRLPVFPVFGFDRKTDHGAARCLA
jgi:hypothetical protein